MNNVYYINPCLVEFPEMSKKDDNHSTVKIKIVSLGEPRVGKSSLINRFCEGNKFASQYMPTIGLDNFSKQLTVDNTPIYVHFWDMSGDDSYFEVRNEFYGDTDGFLMVFDLASRDSFNQIAKWVDEAKRYGADISASILCGNKSDSPKLNVSPEEGAAYAKRLGIQFFETSARSGKNVNEAFNELMKLMLRKMKRK